MRVNRSVFILINVLISLAVVATAGVVGWFLLNLDVDTKEAEVTTQMYRLDASARTYYARMGLFGGLCSDIGLPSGYRCNASDAAYAIETDLGPGRFYCLDSTGFSGKTRISKSDNTVCRQY